MCSPDAYSTRLEKDFFIDSQQKKPPLRVALIAI